MNEYLQQQITLLDKLRRLVKTTGISAGAASAVIPIITTFITFSGVLGAGGSGLFELGITVTIIAFPLAINFMVLEIALRGRIADLNHIGVAVGDPESLGKLLASYLGKIVVHRIILWIVGALLALQAFGQIQDLGMNRELLGFYLGQSTGLDFLVGFLAAAFQVYLGIVLSRQVKALPLALNPIN